MKKKVISKETIQVGDKHYTEEKYWPMFPSDRIITSRTRKLTFGDLFNILEFVALTWIAFFLIKFLFDFAAGMEALSQIDKVIRGY